MNRLSQQFRKFIMLIIIMSGLLTIIASGGGSGSGGDTPVEGEVARSTLAYDNSPVYTPVDQQTMVTDLLDFTFDFFHEIEADPEMPGKNFFFSPYSIINALAMTWAGAENDTAGEMAQALRISLPEETFHPVLNGLNIDLNSRDDQAPAEGDAFQLNLVNAVWSQDGYPLLPSYLDTLAINYDAGVRLLDFAVKPEASRKTINQWVEEQTHNKIIDLLPTGSISPVTVLVLTNAVYFKASWFSAFETAATTLQPFCRLDDSNVSVAMMHQHVDTRYYQNALYDAVELPYVSSRYESYEYPLELSMLIIIPQNGSFETVIDELDTDLLNNVIDSLTKGDVVLTLPRFSFTFDVACKKLMMNLGMLRAFDAGLADFSGMADPDRAAPHIDEIYHKAFIAVDEEGTEAAAATAVVMSDTSAIPDPVTISADKPFVFLIRDNVTQTVLFIGRMVDPSA